MTFLVAPGTGAWIETGKRGKKGRRLRSLPVRERGLKQQIGKRCRRNLSSLPVRERGLKQEETGRRDDK